MKSRLVYSGAAVFIAAQILAVLVVYSGVSGDNLTPTLATIAGCLAFDGFIMFVAGVDDN